MVIRTLLLICCLLPSTLLAKVNATVNQRSLYPSDVVILTIEVENQDGEPDFSSLNKTFRIGGTSQSQQISIINGSRTDRTTWRIELQPLAAGNVVIPSIQVGDEQTQPILLTIKQPTEQEQAQTANNIFVTVDIEGENQPAFVQQQIRYSVRLFYRIPLLDGELSTPLIEHTIIEQLGEGERYRVHKDGSEYQVIERHYAIFPEKSGPLTIPPIRFQGRISVNTPQQQRPRSTRERFFQDNFFNQPRRAQRSRPVEVESEAITLQIAPQPDQYSGQHWLPSEQISLKDSWAKSPPEFRAGQPVSRTITIEAKGLAASHIPQLTLDIPDHLRIYPEPTKTESVTDGSWVYGQSEQRFTYIPSQSGRQKIPAVTLVWWNITTGEQQSSTLPAWQIDVLPPLEEHRDQPAAEIEKIETKKVDEAETLPAQPHESESNWLYLALTILLISLLLMARYLNQLKAFIAQLMPTKDSASKRTTLLADLQRACADNDPVAAKRGLLEFATETWPDQPPLGLTALAGRLEGAEAQLEALDRALYAAEENRSWNGEALWKIVQHGFKTEPHSDKCQQERLAPLYPTL
ncbi:MAG: BatD family protein [Candidatus Polarisedimenticolaceae bacterium]|nr:BatD family protein [Candidatus Polarisedimenticolaceae bacterium]